jgi:hypothetical protein
MSDKLTKMPEQDNGFISLVERAIATPDMDVSKLMALLAFKKEWEAAEAKKAYTAAMNKFKANPTVITRNATVKYNKKTGGVVTYKHATLDHVCDAITAGLTQVGITHRWTVKQEKDVIWVTCVLTHELGHSEETTLMAAPDNSGDKNAIQAIASAVTYLERYTLKAACGLAEQNDNDGQTIANGKGMATDAIEEYCRQMGDVTTPEDLKVVFAKAFNEAREHQDGTAMARIVAVHDARKKEIASANR